MFEQIIVIAGVARSGTSWIAQIIDSSPDVSFRFQPLFSYAFKNAVTEDSNREEYLEFFNSIYNSSDDFLLQTDKRKAGLYPVFKKNSAPRYLALKENNHQYVIPKMMQYFQNLKLLGVVRHPCGSLNSWLQNPKEFPPDADPRKEWRFGSCKNQGKVENFFGYYKWKEVANLYLDLKDKYAERVFIVKYDEIVKDPIGHAKSIFDFLCLQFSEQTTSFLETSHSTHQDNPYAVFKDKSVSERWKSELDPYIITEVLNDLTRTRLEVFLK
jgi:hypothetical protein